MKKEEVLIVLDPGHGGNDPGAVNGNRYESNDVYALALEVERLLILQHVAVLLTRGDKESVSITDRIVKAKKAGATLFVSLHRDGNVKPTANGHSIYTRNAPLPAETALAKSINTQIAARNCGYNRGVLKGDYRVLTETDLLPAVMLEMGFVTSPDDNVIFDNKFTEIAEAIVQGIMEHLNIPFLAHITRKEIHRVQLGAFEIKANAQNYVKWLKETHNLPAFVVTEYI